MTTWHDPSRQQGLSVPSQAARVLTFEDARHAVENEAESVLRSRQFTTEKIALLQSRNRILAEEVIADRNQPPFPRAARDGFAVRAADVASASQAMPVELKYAGEIRAGAPGQLPSLQSGEAIEIMTGAPAPPGADAVVMVEYTRRLSESVSMQRAVKSGENIVPAGAEARCGALLLKPGSRVNHAAVAVAASVGKNQIAVYQRPRVAILSTGDEIVEIDQKPAAHQIRNSNSYSLAAQAQAAGAEPVQLPIAPDEINRLRELIMTGLQTDLLLLSGGVSLGKYDLVEQVLCDLGAEFFFIGALLQPGRPVVFGKVELSGQHKYFFGLPGNPVSAMVTFELFARPMIQALCGAHPQPLLFLQTKLKNEIRVKPGLTRFLPALLSGEHVNTEVELVKWQGSGDVVATAQANCYVVIPPHRERVAAGEMVSIMTRI